MLLLLAGLLVARNIIRVQTAQCPMQGNTPYRDSGLHNFVIDSLDGNNFPFAIGQCTATSLNPTDWYIYSCNNDNALGQWIVTKTEYSDDQCSGNGTFVLDWDTQFDAVQQYYECGGSDTYLQIELSIGACQSPVTIYAALSSCVHDSSDQSSNFEFFCNDTTALVHYFGSFGNETLMSTTEMAQQSTTALPLSSTNIMIYSTSEPVSTTEMEMNMSTTPNLDLNMSTNIPISTNLLELNFSTSNLLDLNMSTNIPISTSFLPSLLNTNILSTLISSFMPSLPSGISSTCDDSDYCDVWVLTKDDCILAKPSSLRNYQVYAKMRECGVSKGQQTTGSNIQTDKSGSIHSPLAITGILSLLFAVYWF
jgi:hypothetical protein